MNELIRVINGRCFNPKCRGYDYVDLSILVLTLGLALPFVICIGGCWGCANE